MAFWLFLLLNGVLLLRPEELFPEIAGLRLYLIAIGLCLVTALPQLAETLQPHNLTKRPLTLCVLGVWAASILSQLARGQVGVALEFGAEFGKVMLYYLILVSVVTTPARFRTFLGVIVALVLVSAGLGLLQFHGMVNFTALTPLERKDGVADGEDPLLQLRSSGIFNDPNDLCLILVTASICALARSFTSANVLPRVLWLTPIGVFGYAVVLTQSRGGLLGLLVALVVWVWGRFGWRWTLPVVAVLGLGLPLVASGRQANLSLGRGDTAHERFALWQDGFVAMMRNPVTGIGAGEYADEMGLVAHNSFVHAYVELGLLGGSWFLGAFLLAAGALFRSRPEQPLLAQLRPFVLAMLVGYAGGVFSISRDYVIPTYLVLGVADAFLAIAGPSQTVLKGAFWLRLLGMGLLGWLGLRIITSVLLAI